MPNILTNMYNADNDKVTPVFSSPVNYSSSEVGASSKAIPRLKVTNTQVLIKKIGENLSVGDKTFDISYRNILDVVRILQSEGVSIKFLDNTEGWNLPALCIRDFTNKEYSENELSYLPFDLNRSLAFKGQGIEALTKECSVVLVLDTYTNKKSYKVIDNLVTFVQDFKNTDKILFNVFSKDFLIKVDPEAFTTSKTDLLAKHMDTIIK